MANMKITPVVMFPLIFVLAGAAVFFLVKTTLNRKPGVPYFPGDAESPNNIVFRPHQLTAEGLKARRYFFGSWIAFVVTLIGTIVWSMLAEN
jgi:hypothetical protein